ncbi:hypothetical protein WH47_00506 [Habropoda laboriosa]|uniref:Uncharacterized protein n=1 Tax=Habropoda laboriosa TaxID=597456 RepID=A0A0L7R459_9HYME|nr:hypothetical protein WH47_00506 [Habropoda laboriosa]
MRCDIGSVPLEKGETVGRLDSCNPAYVSVVTQWLTSGAISFLFMTNDFYAGLLLVGDSIK